MELCKYGCGNEGLFSDKNGDLRCTKSPNSCPANRRKNSSGCKVKYASGTRKRWYDEPSEKIRSKLGWAKGLNKSDPRIAKAAKAISAALKGKPGHKHTEETKAKLSQSRIKYLEEGNHSKWYEIGGVKVQGNLERRFATFLFEQNIEFSRNRITFQKHKTYTPDFYIPSLNVFVEVKGFFYDKDKEKLRRVLFDNDIDIRIVFEKDIGLLTCKQDILNLDSIKDHITNIDYSKFVNHWAD